MAARREILQNDTNSTLSGSVSAGATTIPLVSGGNFPATGDFRVLVDSELMLCTARSGNNLTVVRGIENTAAASHNGGATVTMVLTKGGLQKYLRDNVPYFDTARPPMRIVAANGDLIDSTDFTVVNASTATIADNSGRIVITKPTAGSTNVTLYTRNAPSTPYKVRACISGLLFDPGDSEAGIAFRESSSGKFIDMIWWQDANNPEIGVFRYTSPTAFVSTAASPSIMNLSHIWLELEDDGTDLFFRASVDGVTWTEIHSEARGAFFDTAPDQVALAVERQGGSLDMVAQILAWDENS